MPVSSLKGIGSTRSDKLAKLGIVTVSDLLTRYPKDYEDRATHIPLRDYNKQRIVCTVARVIDHKTFFYQGAYKTKIIIEDESARAVIPCFFTGEYLPKRLFVGGTFRISGHFEKNKYGEIQSTGIIFEDASQPKNEKSKFFGIVPVYYYSDYERNSLIRYSVKTALDIYGTHIEDELPSSVIEGRGLFCKSRAIRSLHFPENTTECDNAVRSVIFEELFYLEILIGKRRKKPGGINVSDGKLCDLQKRFCERLPFKLTLGQQNAIREINSDMDNTYPMARLLQGDVGSGKTLVAFFAALRAISRGEQAVLMAPTELLARQHAENAAAIIEPLGIHVAFLTGNIKSAGRARLIKALSDGNIDFLIGTHALFSRDVIYKKLALVIIDEQHRFGVTQREAIRDKGEKCDLLMMSATPIPRSLAMTVFGDMDISTIPDMPYGRKPVVTHLVNEVNENKVYDFVQKEVDSGRQAYFVYPLIESNENSDIKDARSMYTRLSKEIFSGYKCALIHSRIDEEEKRNIIKEFRANKIHIIVATSVVEVGVDVPNATCMIVEHAERFGLSSLHQLRGRVGRGEYQSYCFLIYARQNIPPHYINTDPLLLNDNERSKEGKRLMILLREYNGFKIAEEDLKFRGPGEIAGTEQSGFMKLGLSDPMRDMSILEEARYEAFSIINSDPEFTVEDNKVIARVINRIPPFAA